MAMGRINGEAVKSGNPLWYQVDHQGQRGFIYADYVSASPPTITPLPPPPTIPPPRYYGPGIVCADGTISYAENTQGACSGHGGILNNSLPSMPDYQPPTYSYSGGGGTRCRDGTYSSSTGRGTCSHHGGIAR
ncbi:MAG: DUF3761 domain-containing protein [Chloroflexi bacterium]|nr:DUF3761 domain-containing protein [Chloroflexota bacterium]